MATPLSIQNVCVWDRVIATSDVAVASQGFPRLTINLPAGSLGTVMAISQERQSAFIEWDDAATSPSGQKELVLHILPKEDTNTWPIQKIGVRFRKGRIYLLQEDGIPRTMFYPIEDVADEAQRFEVRELVSVRYRRAQPAFGEWSFSITHGETIATGRLVTYKSVTEIDLRWIFHHWEDPTRYSIAEWLRNIRAYEDLVLEEEIQILERVASEFEMAF